MIEQWKELKETIVELRDNDGTGTQQDVCKFLVNYMEVLEKQMQEPVLDKIRAEIEEEYNRLSATRADETLELGKCLGLKMSLKIIDKYKAESEGNNAECKRLET